MTQAWKCTKCGACCQCPRLVGAYDPMLPRAWFPNGVCIHYDKETKLCKRYERRPWACMVEVRFPPAKHEEGLKELCEMLHQVLYGEPWEREGECSHVEKEEKNK